MKKEDILEDYGIAVLSRECSLMGKKEVLTGKAKFGIFGDGKEVPQVAMARAFQYGDFRSGYYRDQTLMMALGVHTVENFFAGLYAHADIKADPTSAGRQMGGHFATHSLDEEGNWKDLLKQKNSSSDISCTAGQMPRLLGLAQASKVYRELPNAESKGFSNRGNEVAWGTIGNASTSEGHFFETLNAAGVMQVPMVISVWDDEYGISVPKEYHTIKQSISEALKGFVRDKKHKGFELFVVKGWDYPTLYETYQKASKIAREQHIPILIHVLDLTQPQGHSTSGSHERYKSPERLQWEKDFDCITKMREWILAEGYATEEDLQAIEESAKKRVRDGKRKAWEAYMRPMETERKELLQLLNSVQPKSTFATELSQVPTLSRKTIMNVARKALRQFLKENKEVSNLRTWITNYIATNEPKYSKYLYTEGTHNVMKITEVAPIYEPDAKLVDARLILRENFDALLTKYPNLLIFGEDVGNIGDVNQGLEGLQKKHGVTKVSDTGIRETTIVGQGIGLAMRGLRPIAEIQYLDYILYGLQTLSDDLATLHYRTFGRQLAPLIVRTRGHRLEGIWHAGSPMGVLLHSLRGVCILTPRNMVKAAGFYNTLLEGNQPAVVVECLNGYRLKEPMPTNLTEFKTPIGVVETLREGKDITVVSYGSTLRIVCEVADELASMGIDIEIIDAQSLAPFDVRHDIVKSIQKTNRLLVVDEDMPGATSAYILQKIVEEQNAYQYLDSAPQTLAAGEHRPAYATDGDYFSKPNADSIIEKIYSIMHEANPEKYPTLL
ncbi:thiamine pyrophosphate-dependent enzyme [Capnocytophaga sp. oral taxon 903]|uniref:alpha-ketoacid dehydrogenase subunit alpha/beta n=1 Tax=Capnocytophaga sp. oral taxon 903 TaxID=2748317 RepID=UPI0015B8EE2D|nr:alpha-ketoacid dehydrogenase subunit alpha/beta [Capnocytophaga sp. oral taxon 903]NWO30235.1 transketolase [Capnocytophaga sp. oral taxon 903]